ncbi:putative exocyst complex component Exo84 [Talaromyces proteolyticus]|uniref:Exocyst complex component EXO84 n=1 Tax=Talaromyces proteolyticus TaxID=1131652 RepID=A0AAD4KTC8_9EURO|nr:putative exocyst complex component Exo84 [Talaromyces proteolyticus]KAH8697857.1 putative exocyst complex component Exo84 [Talaromyces proteolyticus]
MASQLDKVLEVSGLTLRNKNKSRRRPQISAPKPISAPGPPKPPSSSSEAPRPPLPQQSGATSDLVKRRYSARFNQLPDGTLDAPPVPSLPSDLQGYGGLGAVPTASSAPQGGPGQPLEVNLKALRDPSLPVDKYVAGLLANASEEDIQDYQQRLRKVKNRTSTDLQQNVYQNRTQFIKISEEAEKLKGEMRTLRTLMSELTTALGQTHSSSGSNPLSPPDDRTSKRSNRSSVANLENMWTMQLQTLWKTVEGSQKFLPAIPGRHIVLESGHWVELDSATWKPRRPVHIVLLNDHLLVAAKKRKRIDPNSPTHQRGPAPTKLVAEVCWQLQDIDMIDLGANLGSGAARAEAEDRGVAHAINIRVGSKSYTYRYDQRTNSAKNELLSTFRKTVEELRKALRSEIDSANKPGDALRSLTQLEGPRQSGMVDGVDEKDKPEIRIDVDGKQHNLRWVEGQVDELDIDIALHHFEEAVSSVERLRKLARGLRGNSVAQDVINQKVDERAAKLAGILSRILIDKHSFPVSTKTNVGLLTRLGYEDRARSAYLGARSEVIQKRARQCIFEGDLQIYIFQISFVYFTMIKNTISIYQQCFPPIMSSACIKWAKEHLDEFNAALVRQLSSVQRDTSVWQKCLNIVDEQASMLIEVGVDFKDLIQRGLENGTDQYGDVGEPGDSDARE